MQRRSFMKKAGLGLAGTAALAAPAVHAAPTIRWRLASSFPKSMDTMYSTAEVFARQVHAMSGGKFRISVHPAGELLPAFGVVDGLQNGTVECSHTAAFYFTGKDETFALSASIPFGLNTRQMTAWMHEGNGMKLMREFYKNYNIVNFVMGNTNAQMGGWYRKELKSLADMQGLKMRIGGLGGKVFERLGVMTQQIPLGEIYQALEKGTIDASDFIGPHDDFKQGFHKVAQHYYFPGWWKGSVQEDLYINDKAFNALPAEYKSMIEAAAAHAHTWQLAAYDGQNPIALRKLVAGGAKLHRFPREIVDAGFKESMALYSEISAKNPNWKKVYDDFSKFRKEQNMWWKFAESGFDEYMQSQDL